MKKIFSSLLFILLVLAATANKSVAQGTLTMHVTDACTGLPIPNGPYIRFVGSMYYYQCWTVGGTCHYAEGLDPVGCGSIVGSGCTIVSMSPSIFCYTPPCSGHTNEWCGDYDATIDIVVSFPVNSNFNVMGATGSTTSAPTINECAPVGSIGMNTTVSGTVTSYEVQVTQGTFSGSFTPSGATVSTGTITASSVPGYIDLMSIVPSLGSYSGAIQVSLIVNQCTTVTTKTECFNLQIQPPVTAVNFDLSGNVQATPTSTPPTILLCNGATSLTLNPSGVTGTVSAYTIKVEEGSWVGTTFTPGGPSWANTVSASSIPSNNLYSFFTSFLPGYTGYIRVTLSATGPCSGAATKSQVFFIQNSTSITALDFNLNTLSQATPISTPPNVLLCDAAALTLNGTETGSMTSYVIKIEQGSWAGTTFTPIVGIPVSNSYTASSIAAANLNLFAGMSAYVGYIRVTVTAAGPCTASYAKAQVFNIQRSASITASTFNLNTQSQATPTSTPPTVTLCDAAPLTLNGSVTGNLTSYVIKMEQGSWVGTTFTPSGTNASNSYTATSISAVNLLTFTGMSAYSGFMRVTVTATGPCTPTYVNAQVFNIQHATSITAVGFDLNGFTQATPTSTPPVIWICNQAPLLLTGTETGNMTSYTIKLEQGVWSGSSFAPSTSVTNSYTGTSIAPVDINLFTGMSTYSGMIRVTVTASGPCTGFTKAQVFDAEHSSAAVTFQMMANGCSGVTGLATQTTLPIADASFSVSPCVPGWQGAYSGGIVNVAYPAGITSYEIKLDEVNPTTGAFMSNIFDKFGSGPIPSWNFGTSFGTYTMPYFLVNYSTLIASNHTFKVTVYASTAHCTDQAFSYFRIANSGMFSKDGNENGSVSMQATSTDVKVYPNPAENEVNFEWTSTAKESMPSQILILDMYGRTVISKSIEAKADYNKQTIDVAALPTGMYIYKLANDAGISTGKFEKH